MDKCFRIIPDLPLNQETSSHRLAGFLLFRVLKTGSKLYLARPLLKLVALITVLSLLPWILEVRRYQIR